MIFLYIIFGDRERGLGAISGCVEAYISPTPPHPWPHRTLCPPRALHAPQPPPSKHTPPITPGKNRTFFIIFLSIIKTSPKHLSIHDIWGNSKMFQWNCWWCWAIWRDLREGLCFGGKVRVQRVAPFCGRGRSLICCQMGEQIKSDHLNQSPKLADSRPTCMWTWNFRLSVRRSVNVIGHDVQVSQHGIQKTQEEKEPEKKEGRANDAPIGRRPPGT